MRNSRVKAEITIKIDLAACLLAVAAIIKVLM